jgi:hypothetical protein
VTVSHDYERLALGCTGQTDAGLPPQCAARDDLLHGGDPTTRPIPAQATFVYCLVYLREAYVMAGDDPKSGRTNPVPVPLLVGSTSREPEEPLEELAEPDENTLLLFAVASVNGEA